MPAVAEKNPRWVKDCVVHKPVDLAELAHRVRATLDG